MEREKMNTCIKKVSANLNTDADSTKKFRDGEQLWFWFLTCRKKDLFKTAVHFGKTITKNPYPCEAIDVEALITRLYLSGKLTAQQLEVLKEFGDMRRAPNQHIWSENASAALWFDAMQKITTAAKTKNWLEN
jgi:hypothetical protein